MFAVGFFLSIATIQIPFCLHQFFPLTACDSTFPLHYIMQKTQNYGATGRGGAGLLNGLYYESNGWYRAVAGGTNAQAAATKAIQGYTWESGCFPLTSCMTDLNLSGTSTARRAVVLLRAVARLAAMVLPALMPTNLSAIFLDIYLGILEMLTGVRKATLLRLSGPDRSHGSKLLRIGTVASYTMLLEFAIMVRSMGCVTFLWL